MDHESPEFLSLSAEEREILAFLLEQEQAEQRASLAIPRQEDRTRLPLSFAQERLWTVDQLAPQSAAYNIPLAVRLEGPLAMAALEQAFGEIVRRHEPLRTNFIGDGGTPRQVIHDPRPFSLRMVDLSGLLEGEQRELSQQLVADETVRGFDLGRDLLLRSILIRCGARGHSVTTTLHHVAADGWSLGVLSRELGTLYATNAVGLPSPLAELAVQYADYAVWLRERLSGPALESHSAYWREQLRGTPDLLRLPTDRSRPEQPSHQGGLHTFTIALATTEALESLSRASDTTLFMTLLAGFASLLHRYTGETDLCIGTDVANRAHPDTENLIGFFVNQLVVRSNVGGDPTALELLGRVRETMLAAYAHQDLPFEQLVRLVNPERERGITPLFQVKFVLNNTPMEAFQLPGLTLIPMQAGVGGAKFDLLLNMVRTTEGLRGSLEYSADLFEAATVERVAQHFARLLQAMAAQPSARIASLAMLTEGEREALVDAFNQTTEPWSRQQRTLSERFEEQVSRSPDAVALTSGDTTLTYGALNERANRLAHALRARGVGPDVVVGLYVERSLEMVVGLLGVVKAGGAYLPLDPTYPQSRLQYVLTNATPAVVLTTHDLADDLGFQKARVLRLDREWSIEVAPMPASNPSGTAAPENLVYVIYTSGSTGYPKGTMITHQGLSNYLEWASRYYTLSEGGPSLLHSPLGFDLTVTSLWGPLIVGQGVEILNPQAAIDELGAALVATRGSCVLKVTPSHLSVLAHQIPAAAARDLSRVLIVGGEQLTGEMTSWWQTHAPAMRIVNEYGPTETVVGCCIYEMEEGQSYAGAVPIGRPIANTQLYVLDTAGSLAPSGVSGELYIGGLGVARGYVQRADLTAERFVPDQYGAEAGRRLYRSGDLVRLRKDRELEYQGRIDHQIKIRGFRVELGEIEVVLAQHEAVKQAVVVLRSDADRGTQQLVAYLEAASDIGVSALRAHLMERLPEYMVPSVFVVMDALPLTANGKVDRDALPDPANVRLDVDTGHAAPRTEAERTLAALWSEFLEIDEVGIHDNFFELGGDSILSLQIVARCIAKGLPLTSQQLFEHPTIAELGALLEDETPPAPDDQMVAVDLTVPPPIRREERDGPVPLSFAQERLWFLDQLEPGGYAYNIPAAVRMNGPLAVACLAQAFTDIVRRHEALRTTFSTRESGPVQHIHPARPFPAPLVDVSGIDEEAQLSLCRRLAVEHGQRPFDLARGPLLRVTAVRRSHQQHVILLTLHHIVSDGWSMGILVDEVSRAYDAMAAGRASSLAEPIVQYADFAVWQRRWFSGKVLDDQMEYWRQTLSGAPPTLDLPCDRPRPPVQTFRGARRNFLVSAAVLAALKALSQREGATLFMSLMAAFQILLHRWTGREDILVGTPIAGRGPLETQELIGFFVNTLVMRGRVRPEATFRELLGETRQLASAAYAHQELPFEKLVDDVQVERDLSRSPLFQVMFVFENAPERGWASADLTLEPFITDAGIAKFDLMLDMAETEQILKGAFEYNTDLFDGSTIARMVRQFETVLAAVVAQPDRPLGELSLLPTEEARQVLEEWNDTACAGVDFGPVHRLVEAQVGRTPDAVALVTEGQQLTYRELNARANQLARYFGERGVRSEVRVGLCLNRSVDLIVGVLGILKAGGTYVPIDPEYPPSRVAFMIDDSHAAIILTERAIAARVEARGGVTVCLEDAADAIAAQSEANLPDWARPEFLSHVIYTSGSTGRPKGVAIEHRSVATLLHWSREHYSDAELAGVFAGTSICFDLSVWEIFVPLSCGGAVVLGESVLALPRLHERNRVTLINTVPSAIAELLRQQALPASVQTINLAGEPLTTNLSDALYAVPTVRRVCDLYGPSEDTTYSTYAQRAPGGRATIGRPLAGTRVYLRGAAVEPAPVGVPGELYLGGAGLARGYLDRPELTAEHFVPDPFGTDPGGRLYRTGDLVRWLPQGTLEFLGRIDHQVKIRGFRIELGEVQTVLAASPGVRDVVVIARDDGRSGKRLVAYVTQDVDAYSEAELRRHVQKYLPGHMVPAVFVRLDELPLTPNGKVDRSRLPDPDVMAAPPQDAQIAPRTVEERTLAEIWRSVLGVEHVGVHDNFFQLGGDSILSIQIVSRAQRMGLRITPRQLFERQTIAELAEVAGVATNRESEQRPVTGPVPLAPIQEWFFHQNFTDRHHFNQAVLLDALQPLDEIALTRAVHELLAQHDALRMRLRREESRWTQTAGELEESGVVVSIVDLSAEPPATKGATLQNALAYLHANLNFESGPLIRVAYVVMGAGEPERLAVIVHHLVIDGVSWRILLEDLQSAYGQALQGQSVRLAPKTTSFASWAQWTRHQIDAGSFEQEREYWLDRARRTSPPFPVDHATGVNSVASRQQVTVALDAEETSALLRDVQHAYRTQIEDVLLTALGEALAGWTSADAVSVDLESHGRDWASEQMDLSRTVGWFTALYPVVLEHRAHEAAGDALKRTKESLRAVPRRGIGYGALRYASANAPMFAESPTPQLSFNYLGQFDSSFDAAAVFRWASDSSGPAQSGQAIRTHLLEVSGVVANGRLRLSFGFSENIHRRQTIEQLADRFIDSLQRLIRHCQTAQAGGRTLSDFPLARIEQTTLDRILDGNRAVEDLYPLSPMQSGLLFHTLSDPGSGVYLEQFSCTLRGPLDVKAFRRAWQAVVDRHAALRTCIRLDDPAQPLQCVVSDVALPWEYADWQALAPSEQRAAFAAYLSADRARGFDLSVPPLMRVALFKTGPDTHRFVWSHHHLLLDGWSIPLVMKEVISGYEAFSRGEKPALERPTAYRDFIAWLGRQDLAAAEAFWRESLRGFSSTTTLGVETSREAHGGLSDANGTQRVDLSEDMSERLRVWARDRRFTLNTLFQGAWSLLLGRYAGADDVVFGATVAGRPPELPGVEGMVGLFINTIPVRVLIDGAETVTKWLERLQANQMAARGYEYAPLSQVQAWSEVPAGTPLFESVFVFENYPIDEAIKQGPATLGVEDVRVLERTNYPLTVVIGAGHRLAIRVDYDAARYRPDTVERMLEHFLALLDQLTAASDRPLSELSPLSAKEQSCLLEAWNAPAPPRYEHALVQDWIETHALRTPDGIAVMSGPEWLTYRELNGRANQLARHLRVRGVGPDTLVGVWMERSSELMVALLGILKAGGAFLPMDPGFPDERLRFMVEDTGVRIVLSRARTAESISWAQSSGLSVVSLDSGWAEIAAQSPAPLSSGCSEANIAYVIYTSGSTGRPKGTVISHQGLTNYLAWSVAEYEVAKGHGAPVHSSIGFDLTITSLLAPLVAGRTVAMVGDGAGVDSLVSHLQRTGTASFVKVTPSHLELLGHHVSPSDAPDVAKALIVGGEALHAQHVDYWRTHAPATRIINEYGPTEAVVGCCIYEIADDFGSSGPVPIGTPVAGTPMYVKDAAGQLSPVGVAGEAFIGGIQLARGYLGRPALTAEKFVPDALGGGAGARLYRTGDLARWRGDGRLEFLGRRDHQVKLRGYRIELGEIETVLVEHTNVSEAAVVVREDEPGVKRLIAYVVAQGDDFSVPALRAHLAHRLPDYMVPAAFVVLPSLPLATSGKVDRRALPAPDEMRPELETAFVDARTTTETTLARIWSIVLHVDRVGVRDNFFQLGGDSILAMQIAVRAGHAGIRLTPRQVFEHQTIADLAAVAGTAPVVVAEQGLVTGTVPLVPIQAWFFEQEFVEPHHYNQSVLLEVNEPLDMRALERAVEALLRHHDALRMRFVGSGREWTQLGTGAPDSIPVRQVDLSALPERDREPAFASAAAAEQASLRLDSGSLVRVVQFVLGSDQPVRLLIAIHHLVVDGVSWRILLEDLQAAYDQASSGRAIELPPKTTSFAQWARRLTEFAAAHDSSSSSAYWLRGSLPSSRLPVDHPDGINTVASRHSVTLDLTLEQTEALLRDVPHVYRTQINDLLLTSLVQTLAEWTGERAFLIDLEGHGRDAGFDDVDVSRTVGWFTRVFPVRLEWDPQGGPGRALLAIKEHLRAVPDEGIGYGLLRYLSPSSVDVQWDAMPQAQVAFNYLGQFDQALKEDSRFTVASESTGPTQSGLATAPHLLQVAGMIVGRRLRVSFQYSESLHARATIETLAQKFANALGSLIEHCLAPEAGGASPSDFPLIDLDQATLDRLLQTQMDIK